MATPFSPQLVIPAAGNPYYNTKTSGGYSPCALGNPKNRNKGLNVLPNCVGYAVGRFNEIGAYGFIKWLAAKGNACDFINIAKKQGLQVVDRPVVGGVMVWKGGSGGYGHVAVPELDLGSRFITSESEWDGKQFAIYKRFGKEWADGCYWMGSSFKYLGCIVNPAMKEEKDMTKEETEKLIRSIVPGIVADTIAELEKTRAEEPASSWAQNEERDMIQEVKDTGLMSGDPSGNFRPQSYVKREELAAVTLAINNRIK